MLSTPRTSSQETPPVVVGLRFTIFKFDFLEVPSWLKTLSPLIVTFSRNLKVYTI